MHGPRVDHGKPNPHQHEPPECAAAYVRVITCERPFAIQPEAEHRATHAADDIGWGNRHDPLAERQHQAVFDHPLDQADRGVAA